MQPTAVIKHHNVIKNILLSFGASLIVLPLHALFLQARKEALRDRVGSYVKISRLLPKSANIRGYSSLTIYRFKHRLISLVVKPSRVRRSTYVRVRGSLRIRTIAIVQSALFAALLPPLFNRCLTVFPEDAGSGFTPHYEANAASLFRRSGLSPSSLPCGSCCRQAHWLSVIADTPCWRTASRDPSERSIPISVSYARSPCAAHP